MKEIIGISICFWILFKYYCYMADVEEWKRKQRYPQATPRKSKPHFLNIKSKDRWQRKNK